MPIRGALLIFIGVIVLAAVNHNEIYDWFVDTFGIEENEEEENEE